MRRVAGSGRAKWLRRRAPPWVGRSPRECGRPGRSEDRPRRGRIGPALRDVVRRDVTGQGQDHQAEHGHHRSSTPRPSPALPADRPRAAAGPAATSTKAVPIEDQSEPGHRRRRARDRVGHPRDVRTATRPARRPRPADRIAARHQRGVGTASVMVAAGSSRAIATDPAEQAGDQPEQLRARASGPDRQVEHRERGGCGQAAGHRAPPHGVELRAEGSHRSSQL